LNSTNCGKGEEVVKGLLVSVSEHVIVIIDGLALMIIVVASGKVQERRTSM